MRAPLLFLAACLAGSAFTEAAHAGDPPAGPAPPRPAPPPAAELPVPGAMLPPAPPLPPPPYFPVNFSFLFPLSTNAGTPDLWTHLDLALILGRVGYVDGVQLGLLDYVAHGLRGAQIGAAAITGDSAAGLQVGGAFAYADGPFTGVQIAGLAGWALHDVHGLQIGGAGNQVYGDFEGVEVGGVANLARQQVTGVQAAGLFNIGRVNGLQLGVINVSQEVRGAQVGILNVARRIDGLQLGVINVTDRLDGESIGLAPIPRRGGVHVVVWGSSSIYGNVGLKFASVYAYSILSFALHDVPSSNAPGAPLTLAYGGGVTVGARVPLGSGVSLSGDLGVYHLFQDIPGHDEVVKTRVLLSYELAKRFTPFLGGGAQVAVRGEPLTATVGPEVCGGLEF
jgi:hypothetical protein